MVEASTTSLSLQLLSGHLDLAVVNLPADDVELATEQLFEEDLVLVAPDDHPLAQRDRVTLAQLADYPLLLSAPGTALRDELEVQAARAGVRLQPQAELDGVRLAASLAFKGFGAAVLPATAVPAYLTGPWKRLPVRGLARRSVGLAYRRRGHADAPGRRSRRHRARGRASPGDRPAGPAPGPPHTGLTENGRNFRCVRVAIRAGTRGCVTARVDDIGGRPAVVVEIDPTDRKGALSSDDGESIAIAAHIALAERMPLVGYIASSGADIVEGMAALHGWGLAARAIADCSGIVPVVLAVTGPAVSGPALLLGLADLVVMTADAYAFVSGPTMVTEFTGVRIDSNELGGAHVHARHTGAASHRRRRRREAAASDGRAAARVPPRARRRSAARAGRRTIRPTGSRPRRATCSADASTGSYDVRVGDRAIVDDGELARAARSVGAEPRHRASRRSSGRPVGIVANQPLAIAGTLDIPASQKGARFVGFCDAFNLPIITLVDTPGFYPGKDLEWRGMIRHGAQLAFAYARATVPRICIILRKSYGGAYIVMDSKQMGNDLCLAWPTAELAVMGAERRDRDPASPGHARGASAARGRLRGAAAEPVRRRRAGVRRRRDRARRHPCGDRTRARDARHQARVARAVASTTTRRSARYAEAT